MARRWAAGLTCGIAVATTLAAEPARPDPVAVWDSCISAHAANGDFSGVVLVTRRGQRVYERAAGMASRSFDVPIRPDTRFLVASVTKTFTAAAVALLEKQGTLKIDEPLQRHLPEFPPARKILLWHLLAHRAGLAEPDEHAIAGRELTPDELLASIAARPPLFEPGADSRYSNAGYAVLGRVIEKVAGKPFGEFLHARIFTPLGMSSSGTLRSGAVVPRLAVGYVPGVGDELLLAPPRDPSPLFGSGNVYSTAADLDRWLTAVDRGELFDIAAQPYPFGWGKRTWFGRDVLVQSGIAHGYSSIILTVPAEELHVVVLMNTQSGFTGDEGKALLGVAYGEPVAVPARRGTPPPVPQARLAAYTGRHLWGEGKVPMHIETDGRGLALRWADSSTRVRLTPLSESEFLDRTSFGRIRFLPDGLVWTQNGEDTRAPRAPS